VHPEYHGSAYALAMNAELLQELAGPIQPHILKPERVADSFHNWLRGCGWKGGLLNVAGKNFASFDWQFLKKLPNFQRRVSIRHGIIDPGMLYWSSQDTNVPDTNTCYKRAGLDLEVLHTAVADALGVVKLIRSYYCV
jgi:hypothetical protein